MEEGLRLGLTETQTNLGTYYTSTHSQVMKKGLLLTVALLHIAPVLTFYSE